MCVGALQQQTVRLLRGEPRHLPDSGNLRRREGRAEPAEVAAREQSALCSLRSPRHVWGLWRLLLCFRQVSSHDSLVREARRVRQQNRLLHFSVGHCGFRVGLGVVLPTHVPKKNGLAFSKLHEQVQETGQRKRQRCVCQQQVRRTVRKTKHWK